MSFLFFSQRRYAPVPLRQPAPRDRCAVRARCAPAALRARRRFAPEKVGRRKEKAGTHFSMASPHAAQRGVESKHTRVRAMWRGAVLCASSGFAGMVSFLFSVMQQAGCKYSGISFPGDLIHLSDSLKPARDRLFID